MLNTTLEWLYFGFDVTDDVLYGIDTERWLPDVNPKAHELTRDGYPWFGDEMEILLNATDDPPQGKFPGSPVEGNGHSWQMVCNLTKSRLGGVGVGGILEGEPRANPDAWDTYHKWIQEGAQKCAAKVKPSGKGYVLEWAIRFKPCLETGVGVFYTPAMGKVRMRIKIVLGDLDSERSREWQQVQLPPRTMVRAWRRFRRSPCVGVYLAHGANPKASLVS